MLFATSIAIMEHLGEELKSMFNITDLGKPSKIVGIEITHSLMISQPHYINSILQNLKARDARREPCINAARPKCQVRIKQSRTRGE